MCVYCCTPNNSVWKMMCIACTDNNRVRNVCLLLYTQQQCVENDVYLYSRHKQWGGPAAGQLQPDQPGRLSRPDPLPAHAQLGRQRHPGPDPHPGTHPAAHCQRPAAAAAAAHAAVHHLYHAGVCKCGWVGWGRGYQSKKALNQLIA